MRGGIVALAAAMLPASIGPAPASAQVSAPTFPLAISPDAIDPMADRAPSIELVATGSLQAFRSRRVPHARHVFWQDTIDPDYAYFGAVLPPDGDQRRRRDILERFDLAPRALTLVYDDAQGFRAARLVWFCRFLGIDSVALLDGGIDAWMATSARDAAPRDDRGSGTVDVMPREGYYLVTSQLVDRVEAESVDIIDTRTVDERDTELGPQVRRGTIPGAQSLPWTHLVDQTGRLTPADRVRDALQGLDIDGDRPIVVFGTYGCDAALPWLALRHAGVPEVVCYDRGWIEWGSRSDLPIDVV